METKEKKANDHKTNTRKERKKHSYKINGYNRKLNRNHSRQLFFHDYIAGDHNIHTDTTICNIEEPPQKYRLVTVSNRLQEGLNMFYWNNRPLLL